MVDTYLEAMALLKEYNPARTYKRGEKVIHDTKVYRCSKEIKQPEEWTKSHWSEMTYEKCVGVSKNQIHQFKNVEVSPKEWSKEWKPTKDMQQLAKDYPYRARLKYKGVTSKMIPYVFFSSTDATSGIYAPVAETGKNVIYIYAKRIPTEKICIPCVKCIEEAN